MNFPARLLAGAIIAIILALLAYLVITVPAILEENREGTGHHVIEYTIRISSDTSLDNLTLLLPLPTVRGSFPLGDDLVNGSGYGVPPGWNLSLESQNGSPFLKITGAQFVPERTPYPVAIDEDDGENISHLRENFTSRAIPLATTVFDRDTRIGTVYAVRTGEGRNATGTVRNLSVLRPVELGVRRTIATAINTRDPFGSEPLLEPKEDIRETGAVTPVTRTARSFAYASPVYLDYRSDKPAKIEISVSVLGSNEWWELGWSSNSYTDRIFASLPDGGRGWVRAEGFLVTGNGRY